VLSQAVSSVLGGLPARQSGELHVRMQLRERRRPIEFRRRYVVRGAGDQDGLPGVVTPMVADLGSAIASIDEYNLSALHLTRVDVLVTVRRGLRQSFLLRGKPRSLKRGRTSPCASASATTAGRSARRSCPSACRARSGRAGGR
jgi:hypothetical protein